VLSAKIKKKTNNNYVYMKKGDLVRFWDHEAYELTDENFNLFSFPLRSPTWQYGIFISFDEKGDRVKILHRGIVKTYLTVGINLEFINR
jgi:hypothetical protein